MATIDDKDKGVNPELRNIEVVYPDENGNRAQRRAAAKLKKKKGK